MLLSFSVAAIHVIGRQDFSELLLYFVLAVVGKLVRVSLKMGHFC